MNCFELTKRGETEAAEAAELVKVDEDICKYMGAELHSTKWYRGWYGIIGLSLACGRSFEEIIESLDVGNPLYEVARFLDAKYTVKVWAER